MASTLPTEAVKAVSDWCFQHHVREDNHAQGIKVIGSTTHVHIVTCTKGPMDPHTCS